MKKNLKINIFNNFKINFKKYQEEDIIIIIIKIKFYNKKKFFILVNYILTLKKIKANINLN